MLTSIPLDDLRNIIGGADGFARYGGWNNWLKTARGQQYQDFMKLRADKANHLDFGAGGEWGKQYAAYKKDHPDQPATTRQPEITPRRWLI